MKHGILPAVKNFVAGKLPDQPKIGLILGSGLAATINIIREPIIINYAEIPGFPPTTVPGHLGQFVFGYVHAVPILAASGRYHYYEGHSLPIIQLPVRTLAALGVELLIITNAAGCTNENWSIGDFMVHTGYLDCTFIENSSLPHIVSGPTAHSERLIQAALAAAAAAQIKLRRGTYACTVGPTFETPAEVALIRDLGGDAVGMSAIPEYLAAVDEGLEVVGISCLTNYTAKTGDLPIKHATILAVGTSTSSKLATLLEHMIEVVHNG